MSSNSLLNGFKYTVLACNNINVTGLTIATINRQVNPRTETVTHITIGAATLSIGLSGNIYSPRTAIVPC